jgi:hypothetical protein
LKECKNHCLRYHLGTAEGFDRIHLHSAPGNGFGVGVGVGHGSAPGTGTGTRTGGSAAGMPGMPGMFSSPTGTGAVVPGAAIEFDDATSQGSHLAGITAAEAQALQDEVEELRERLHTLQEEYEDQEVEMLEVMEEKDRSADALLYFAIMHDPSYVTNLQQLVLQINQLKGFCEGSTHMDFLTLKKRIQVCVVMVPSVEKLVGRYTAMYQKWSNYRLNWFSARKLNGGSADSFNSCPLCFQDVAGGGDRGRGRDEAEGGAVTRGLGHVTGRGGKTGRAAGAGVVDGKSNVNIKGKDKDKDRVKKKKPNLYVVGTDPSVHRRHPQRTFAQQMHSAEHQQQLRQILHQVHSQERYGLGGGGGGGEGGGGEGNYGNYGNNYHSLDTMSGLTSPGRPSGGGGDGGGGVGFQGQPQQLQHHQQVSLPHIK